MMGQESGAGYAKLVSAGNLVEFAEGGRGSRLLRGTVVDVMPIETGEAIFRIRVEGRKHFFLRPFREVTYVGE